MCVVPKRPTGRGSQYSCWSQMTRCGLPVALRTATSAAMVAGISSSAKSLIALRLYRSCRPVAVGITGQHLHSVGNGGVGRSVPLSLPPGGVLVRL